ncbi:hypothetical protein [Nakamurella sp.]|uniref:hypothetical protein n=1 Tax=Nakamurella sp. TaxID=1869182 RepID=UPI003B3AD767
MLVTAVVLGTGAVVVGALGYLWRHRDGRLARGVAEASVTYNMLNGQAAEPTMPHFSDTHDRPPDRF